MNIEIRIKNKIVEIILLKENDAVDKVIVAEEYRLSEDLLPEIDKLLIKNNLCIEDVDKMVLQSDMGENFTTHRIASATVNAFNWGKLIMK